MNQNGKILKWNWQIYYKEEDFNTFLKIIHRWTRAKIDKEGWDKQPNYRLDLLDIKF